MENLEPLLAEHPFCRGLPPEQLTLLAGCAALKQFAAEQLIAREGDEITEFFLVRSGRVALEIFTARRGALLIQTRGAGDFLGWLGLPSPATWTVDARAQELTRVIALRLDCLAGLLTAHRDLGFELMQRFIRGMAQHFKSMKHQLVNLIHGL